MVLFHKNSQKKPYLNYLNSYIQLKKTYFKNWKIAGIRVVSDKIINRKIINRTEIIAYNNY